MGLRSGDIKVMLERQSGSEFESRMKSVVVVKKTRGIHCRQRTLLHLEKRVEKPKKVYGRHLGRVLSQVQQPMSQCLWTLDALNRQNITTEGFQAIASEAARLSHFRRRITITRMEIFSALKELYPAVTVRSPETCHLAVYPARPQELPIQECTWK